MKSLRQFLTQLGVWTASPIAFAVLALFVGFWVAFRPATFDWQAVATMGTWFMTLIIQRAEHRDTQALHAKLDELLHVNRDASNAVARLDEREPEEIEEHRREARRED